MFARTKSSAEIRYALAFLGSGIALIFWWLLGPSVFGTLYYITLWPVVIISAWHLGFGPSIVTVLSGSLGVWYFLLHHSFVPRTNLWDTLAFLSLSGLVVALGNANRRQTAKLEHSNQTLRQLSQNLMRAQDEERRRIARDLHDSAGQYLAALGMNLNAAQREAKNLPLSARQNLQEAIELTRAFTSEIRTTSHLLHPPLLDELGLISAVRWFTDGFAARSGIQVRLEIPETLRGLGKDLELVLFRILQESLTNVHRHSKSKTACVRIGVDSQEVWLEVQDHSKESGAISPNRFQAGVGITGMRERVAEFRGQLEIASDNTGTRVKAVIPVPVELQTIVSGVKADSAVG